MLGLIQAAGNRRWGITEDGRILLEEWVLVTPDTLAAESEPLFDALHEAANNPAAKGKSPGTAFEEAIASVSRSMGFDAKRVGGAGDTDVVVRWRDAEGKTHIAIVDGKSKSSGTVSHSDISDVAIERGLE